MVKIKYGEHRFHRRTMQRLEDILTIVEEYQEQGYTLTLRQLHYQLVSRNLTANTQQAYVATQNVVANARLAGLLDWEAIEDRGRFTREPVTWDSPAELLSDAARQYKRDLWATQPCRPLVMVEKDALLGVLEVACEPFRVPYTANRGYSSHSALWRTGRQLRGFFNHGQKPVVFLLTDHDPSGLDMRRVTAEALSKFAEQEVDVQVLALRMEQVEQHKPPPNWAKESDTRFPEYKRLYGAQSWELDSLTPDVLVKVVQDAITGILDIDAWNAAIKQETNERRVLMNSVSANKTGEVD